MDSSQQSVALRQELGHLSQRSFFEEVKILSQRSCYVVEGDLLLGL